MSYRLINANSIVFNSDGFITAENIEKMPCIYADLPNGMDGEHYVLEQEPKTGHWKRISMDKYSEHAKYWYKCDRCGKDNLGNTDWCPNCGAKMVDPQESEE